MTRPDERRYRRLLRWYPRSWRREHGEVLLGLLLDDAGARGRVAPSAGDRIRAARDGTGSRLTGRVALTSSLLGLGAAALAGVGSIWALDLLVSIGAGWILYALTTGVAPALAMLGLVSLARDRGTFTEGRALSVLGLGAPALVLGALATASWVLGFTRADAGLPPTPFEDAWFPFVIAGLILGSIAFAAALDAHFTRDGMGRGFSAAASIPLGALLAISAAPALLQPIGSGLVAAIIAAVAIAARRPSPPRSPAPASIAPAPRRAPTARDTMRVTRGLSVLSALGSTLGIAFAFTGSRWETTGGAVDATEAMGQGISLALLSAVPLIAALAVKLAGRGLIASRHTFGPAALIALWFAAVANGYADGADGSLGGWFAVGAVLFGAAVTWWATPRVPGLWRARFVLAAVLGVAGAVFVGALVAPMLAFGVPIAAVVLAVRSRDRPRGTDAARPESVLVN